jgi:hypothetical protein
MEDAAWGKQSDLAPKADVPDNEEMVELLKAVLRRDPTDNELRAAARIKAERELPPDQESGLPLSPRAPAETDEERQARLRASADELLKNAKCRNDARGARDLGAEPREWDTRARSTREPSDETNEQRQARLRATAEGFRRNAKRHEARGAHDKAAEAREWADKLGRDARALTQEQAPRQPRSVSDQEPELPMPRQKGGKS